MNKSTTVASAKFFILTYILSWSIWISLLLASSKISEGISNIMRLFGILMPAISATALTAHYSGGSGVRQLFSRLKVWRVNGKWWLVGILVYPVLLVFAGLLYNLFAPQTAISILPIEIVSLVANTIFLFVAAIGEEIGWRGVALPALQRKYSPITSSLVLGLLWSAWHLPFWILIGTLSQFGSFYFLMNFLFIVPTTFFITWFFNNTQGSILLPLVFHVAFNVVNVAVFPVTMAIEAFGIFIVIQFAVMLVIIPRLRKAKPFTL